MPLLGKGQCSLFADSDVSMLLQRGETGKETAYRLLRIGRVLPSPPVIEVNGLYISDCRLLGRIARAVSVRTLTITTALFFFLLMCYHQFHYMTMHEMVHMGVVCNGNRDQSALHWITST